MPKMNLKIEHQVPGRVRMKISAGKRNPELLKQISEVFAVIPGIEEIVTNPTTGSVVLRYDTDRHDEFHGSFREHYEAHGAGPMAPPTAACTVRTPRFRQADKQHRRRSRVSRQAFIFGRRRGRFLKNCRW